MKAWLHIIFHGWECSGPPMLEVVHHFLHGGVLRRGSSNFSRLNIRDNVANDR